MVGREKRVKYGKRHRVVDHIVGYLAASGVDYIFGADGANNSGLAKVVLK